MFLGPDLHLSQKSSHPTTPSWINWTIGILICYSFFMTILTLVLALKLMCPPRKTGTSKSVNLPLTPVLPIRPLPFSSFLTPSPDLRRVTMSPSSTFHSPFPFSSSSTPSFASYSPSSLSLPPPPPPSEFYDE
jgi:hypothetical protein